MRRVAATFVGVLVVTVLAACHPAPTPPPLYQPPVIESVAASPDPAVPGEDVTLTLVTSDDEGVTAVILGDLITPAGKKLPGPRPCTSAIHPGVAPGGALVLVTCSLPAFASNGTWHIEVTLTDRPAGADGHYPGLRDRRIPFEVVGGVDDRSGPKLLEIRTDPERPVRTAPFDLTLRVEDQASPAAFVYTTFWMQMPFHDSNAQCSKPRAELVSPTVTDVTITCTPDPRWAQSGYHRTMPTVRDALGNERNHEVVIYLHDPLPG